MHRHEKFLGAFETLAASPGCVCAPASAPGASTARISGGRERGVLSADPFARLEILREKSARLVFQDGGIEALSAGDPAATLDYVLDRFRAPHASAATPGCALAISYEAAPWFAPAGLRARAGDRGGDVLLSAAFYENMICDEGGELHVRPTGFVREGRGGAAGTHGAWLQKILRDSSVRPARAAPPASEAKIESSLTREEYLRAVSRVQDYIAAGDIYQANLAQRLGITPCGNAPAALWRSLVESHPMPWSAYFDLAGAGVLLSNSPECFLRRRGETLETFPIKGTRASDGNAAAVRELRHDPKELAEHRMILDLERSDLGRVARIGSVSVPAREYVETFGTVHHLVSCVRAQVGARVGLGAILKATFPGGSITGAPKKRAMEIIDELEPVPRGFYTGTLGTVSANGDFDLSVLIRVAHHDGRTLRYSAGGGIVTDSKPDSEVAESWLKARAFLRACGIEDFRHE